MKARNGDAKDALVKLKQLLQQYPDNPSLLADTTIVANWAGDDAFALELYARAQTPKDNEGVTEAAARSARNLHQFDLALQLYRRAQALSADRWQPRLGEAMVLVDKGDINAAAAILPSLLKEHGQEPDVLAGNAYLCDRQRDFACVVAMDQRLIKLKVRTAESECQMARALADVGAASLAMQMCAQPGAGLQRRLLAALGAEQVRWGEAYAPVAQQQADSRRALETLNRVIASSPAKDDIWQHAQFDRLQALYDLGRMGDVLAAYQQLRAQGITLPDYALQAVAGAYLARRHPKEAEAIYQKIVHGAPENGQAWSSLAFAQFEREHIGQSFRTIDEAFAKAPGWLTAPGLKEPQPNQLHARLGLQAAQMRGYAGLYAQEQSLLNSLLNLAPANIDIRRQLALTYLDRGWPGRAITEDRIAESYAEADETPSLATAEIDEGAGRRDLVDGIVPTLLARDGQTADLTRFLAQRSIIRGWQLEVAGDAAWSSGVFLATTDQHNEAHLYTPLLRNRWRLFAHGWADHGSFVQGDVTRYRSGGGISYNYARQSVWGEVAEDTGTGGDTLAGSLGVNFNLGDHWSVSAVGDSDNLADVQLIAGLNRVRARGVNASLGWRASELRSATLGMQRLLFSDGNQRLVLSGVWNERVHTSPHLSVTLSPQAWASFNSRDAGRIYFNPRSNASLGPQVAVDWLTWRRYDRSLRQELTLYAASSWQQNYDYGAAGSASYLQRWKLGRRVGLYYGVLWNTQPYDGHNEHYTALQYGLTVGSQ